MSAKIISVRRAVFLLALAVVVAGCSPAGPRALLQGKKYLDQGDYAAAAAQFKTATTLLATNAAAWNYYGVALQRAGQPDDSVNAYKRALDLDRDLLEARLNLGLLYLEQNQPEAARTEFTAYTLRRPNDPAGWLKLGSAQLKLGEIVSAERSFSTVYHQDTNNVEALNGFGLARIQRNRAREAAQFFASALKLQPDYASARLNLATVNQQYLRDNKAALEHYRAYLALTPRPANWAEVKAIANSLEAAPVAVAAAPAAPVAKPTAVVTNLAAEPKPQPKPVVTAPVRPLPLPPAAIAAKPTTTTTAAHATPAAAPAAIPAQVVKVAPEPQLVTTPKPIDQSKPAAPAEPALRAPMPEPEAKPGLWKRLFSSSKPELPPEPNSKYVATGVTPLPGAPHEPPAPAAAPPVAANKPAPVVSAPPAPVKFARYQYLSPLKPVAGDRRGASVAFTQAQVAEQGEKWAETWQAYRQAAALDPSWFEAHYNAGVIAQRLRNHASALTSYETALALQPGNVNARYNFALALKAAGHAPDAANELRKILAANPAEGRAHLALANLCAQLLRDPAQARLHYQKVLELDPNNPQTADIRFWLAANPG